MRERSASWPGPESPRSGRARRRASRAGRARAPRACLRWPARPRPGSAPTVPPAPRSSRYGLQPLDRATEVLRPHARVEAALRAGAIGADELPEPLAEDLFDLRPAAVQPQAAAVGEPLDCDLAEDRPQAVVKVEGSRLGEEDQPLDRHEAVRPVWVRRPSPVQRGRERGRPCRREGVLHDEHAGQHDRCAGNERADLKLERAAPRRQGVRDPQPDADQADHGRGSREQPPPAAASASSSSARRPARAATASSFIPASISWSLNFAHANRFVSRSTSWALTASRSRTRATYSNGASAAWRGTP